jgi:hypothetical protein
MMLMENDSVQPGQTVTPSSPTSDDAPAQSPAEPPITDPTPDPPVPEIPAPESAPETPTPVPEQPEQPAQPKQPEPPAPETPPGEPPSEEEPKFDTSQPENPPETPDTTNTTPIIWTASEFIAHAKSFVWYAALTFVAIAFAAFIFMLTKDRVSAGVIVAAALVLGVYAGHKPRELEYRLDLHGLSIGQKHFTYDEFRSFSVLPEGAFSSIVFMPLRRFAVPTTIYYAPEDEDKIVSLLGSRLPLEQRGHDAVDRLMHRIHF